MQIKDEYTVNEVAAIFQTNPETIRKWIRENKLSAIQGNSKKEGIRIEDSSIQDFVNSNSKYSKIALTTATAALITGGLAIPAFLMVKAFQENQALASAIIKSSDVINLLTDEIESEKESISKIQESISSLEQEIQNKNARIESIEQMIKELKGDKALYKQHKTSSLKNKSK